MKINKLQNNLIVILIFGVSLVFNVTFVAAQSLTSRYDFVWGPGATWELRAEGAAPSKALLEILKANVGTAVKHPLLRELLPKSFGIILDDSWNTSEGYFSDELKTSTGAPAILLQPQALEQEGGQSNLVIHELTHLVHHQTRPREANWVKEGLALLVEQVVNGYYNRSLINGFELPETSLVDGFTMQHRTSSPQEQTLAQYGHALQYFSYIYKNCGGHELLRYLLKSPSPATGTTFVGEALSHVAAQAALRSEPFPSFCKNFENSFYAFQKARFFPKVYPSSSWVISYTLRAKIRDQRFQSALLPYTARAYWLGKTQSDCAGEVITFNAEPACFEIRLK